MLAIRLWLGVAIVFVRFFNRASALFSIILVGG